MFTIIIVAKKKGKSSSSGQLSNTSRFPLSFFFPLPLFSLCSHFSGRKIKTDEAQGDGAVAVAATGENVQPSKPDWCGDGNRRDENWSPALMTHAKLYVLGDIYQIIPLCPLVCFGAYSILRQYCIHAPEYIFLMASPTPTPRLLRLRTLTLMPRMKPLCSRPPSPMHRMPYSKPKSAKVPFPPILPHHQNISEVDPEHLKLFNYWGRPQHFELDYINDWGTSKDYPRALWRLGR